MKTSIVLSNHINFKRFTRQWCPFQRSQSLSVRTNCECVVVILKEFLIADSLECFY